jgi:hypothetical protein
MAELPGYLICDECSPGQSFCDNGTEYTCGQGNCWQPTGTCGVVPILKDVTVRVEPFTPPRRGETAQIFVHLTAGGAPVPSGIVVVMGVITPNGNLVTSLGTTDYSGNVTYDFTPSVAGNYSMQINMSLAQVTISGITYVAGGSYTNSFQVANTLVASVLMGYISSGAIPKNGDVTLSGYLRTDAGVPIVGATVGVLYQKPSCSVMCVSKTALTDANGFWEASFSGANTGDVGQYSGWARFEGGIIGGVQYLVSNEYDFSFGVELPVLWTSIHVTGWTPPGAGMPITITGWAFTGQGAVPAGLRLEIFVTGPNGTKKTVAVTDANGSYAFALDGSYHPVTGTYHMTVAMEGGIAQTINGMSYAPCDGCSYVSNNYDVVNTTYDTVLYCDMYGPGNVYNPPQVTRGDALRFNLALMTGQIGNPGLAVVGASVMLYLKAPGASGYSLVGTYVTGANGEVWVDVSTASFVAGTYSFYAQYAGNVPGGYLEGTLLSVDISDEGVWA